MAGSGKIPPEVLNLHTEMVKKLSGLFSVRSPAWRNICNRIVMLGFLTESDKGEVLSMEDLFIKLKKKNVIQYGSYNDIRNILKDENVDAGTIIDDYTKRIKEAFNKMGKRHTSPDSDSDTGEDEPKSKRRKGHHKGSNDSNFGNVAGRNKLQYGEGESGNFRKLYDDTHDARIVFTWQKAMDAVGIIQTSGGSGTGFRVGKDKILTAFHVVKDYIEEEGGKKHLSKCEQDQISITFNFLMTDVSKTKTEQAIPCVRSEKTYYFEKQLIGDRKLDFAVLTLQNKNTAEPSRYPDPIPLFKRPGQTFAIIGHPDGKHMQLDPKVHIFDPTTEPGKERAQKMKKWAHKKRKDSAYGTILDKTDNDKVLFDCWVQHGASGSPGIEMNSNGKPVCSLMLIHGYPDFVFETGYKRKEEDHPYMIEQGVTMMAIAEKLGTLEPNGEKIKQEIFPENSFE